MKGLIFFILYICSILSLLAQNKIIGKIISNKSIPYKNVYLIAYNGDFTTIIDSSKISEDQTYTLNFSHQLQPGVYKISLDKLYGFQIAISTERKNDSLVINLSLEDIKKGTIPLINRENIALNLLTQAYNNFKFYFLVPYKQKQNLIEQDSVRRPDNYREADIEQIKELNKQIRAAQENLNNILWQLQLEYSETYSGKVLTKILYEQILPEFEQDSDFIEKEISYMNEHYFDNWDFSDGLIINNPFISVQYFRYLSEYTKNTDEDNIKAIDFLMNKASVNSDVKEFTLMYLLKTFIRKGPHELVSYINNKYVEGCTDITLPTDILRDVEEVKKLSVGGKIISLAMKNEKRKIISLDSIYEKNKLTILYLWSSQCSYCMEEAPRLLEIYHKYKNLGLEFFAVSVDLEKDEWLKAIDKLKLDWLNVSDLKGYDSDKLKKFYLYKIPILFLLNQKGIIVAKNVFGDELEREIKKIIIN